MQDKQRGSRNRLRGIGTTIALFASGGFTSVASAFPPPPPGDQVVLTGFARDFIGSHPDFDVFPMDGFGHYAGNVSQILGADGAPLQVHGVLDFTINFGSLIPGVPYAARLTVLGAEITSGGTPMPVTIQTETNTDTFEPFGLFNDPATGSVNDANNPRHFIYSLDDIYSAGTPISVTATSWLPQAAGGSGNMGYPSMQYLGSEGGYVLSVEATMPEDGTINSISLYAKYDAGQANIARMGIYTDVAGKPGNLIVETGQVWLATLYGWQTGTVPDTFLPAGTYWLAAFTSPGNSTAYTSSSSSTPATAKYRRFVFDGTNGMPPVLDPDLPTVALAIREYGILASYSNPGTFTEHLSAKSGDNSPYVLVLRNGDSVPSIPGFQNQTNLATFVAPFVNVATQKIVLQDNQAIYLFELGTTNLNSASADFQDLVIMVTLANDPVYFFTPGSQSMGLDPIGYKVAAQWRDTNFDNIAPHTYTPSLGDFSGASGVTSSGGVTSPATYYEWFRDILGENMGMAIDLTLTENGFGVYEFLANNFYPIDGLLYGNEGSGRNDNFTYALEATFTYDASAGQFVEFEGGDGAWIFIDGKLVIDLGGVRSNVRQHADLDRMGLVDGQDYEMRLFYANRNRSKEFKFRTNMFLAPGALLGSPSGFND